MFIISEHLLLQPVECVQTKARSYYILLIPGMKCLPRKQLILIRQIKIEKVKQIIPQHSPGIIPCVGQYFF